MVFCRVFAVALWMFAIREPSSVMPPICLLHLNLHLHHSRATPFYAHLHALLRPKTPILAGTITWLSTRASSTSLVVQTADLAELRDRLSREKNARGGEDWGSPIATPRFSRFDNGSRAGSRVVSARNSRRGSRVSMQQQQMAGAMTPLAGGLIAGAEGYFDNPPSAGIEPDFVDPMSPNLSSDEDDNDEEEVARLATEGRGYGLGGIVDRLMGWSLFSVGEEGASDAEEDEEDLTVEQVRKKRAMEVQRRKTELERLSRVQSPVTPRAGQGNVAGGQGADGEREGEVVVPPPPEDGQQEGGWSDAAWLLSVASKVLL
ncbi:hypothetical protein K402DRAFT_408669 [Aulographum hederae CBS 113979]|uniref:Uncharacterized protein n=1 Tax=Aulographum hederae CBS 113979 TaxID=1176131 RepID=A0A6G1GJI1_9PEZI|nr:hypothetical protein K402DRAFT_408669 [Aulographum hederae CBS 113979]